MWEEDPGWDIRCATWSRPGEMVDMAGKYSEAGAHGLRDR